MGVINQKGMRMDKDGLTRIANGQLEKFRLNFQDAQTVTSSFKNIPLTGAIFSFTILYFTPRSL